MARSPAHILDAFRRRLRSLEHMRKKQEALFTKGQIARRDIEEVYGAIFLNTVVSFEGLIEELFMGLLSGRVRPNRSNVNVRVRIRSGRIARELVLQGQKFFNWLPYEHTKRIAQVFFTGGRPFTVLAGDEEGHIAKCLTVRHAIAHKSRHAMSKFQKEVLAGVSLTPRDRRPKSFLRAQFSANPPSMYYDQLVGELFKIAAKLC